MGFLSSLFGSSKSQPQVTQVQQTQKLPEEIAPKVAEIADEAKRLYDERVAAGYEGYGGATIAPFTQQELDSQAGIEALVGTSAPLQQEALDITRQAGEKFTGDTAQQYMNPYQQAVIDVEKRQAMQDYETKIMPRFEKMASDAGGMSGLGSRAGVQASLLGEAQGQRLGDIQTKGLQAAYAQGRAEFNAQKARERNQAADLNKAGPAMFASGLAEQGALAQVGEQRRDLAQTALDEAYFKYLEEKGEPQAALAEYSNTIYGNPLNTIPSMSQTTTSPGQQGPSTGSQLLGLGMQAASMYYGGGFGGFGGGMTRAEGGRLNDGLSGVVQRKVGSAIGAPERPKNLTTTEAGRQLAAELDAAGKTLEAAAVRASLRKNPPAYGRGTVIEDTSYFAKGPRGGKPADLGLGVYAQTPKNLTGGLQTIEEADKASLSPAELQVINNRPRTRKNVTMPEPAILGMPSTNEQGGGMLAPETGLSRPKNTGADPSKKGAMTMEEILRRQITGMDTKIADRVDAAKEEDLTYRTDRNKLMADQRKAESEAFNKLSDSQTTRLADEMLRRREEITGRDGNITLSKAFGVAAKSFSNPNLSIVQQIAGAMGGMTETVVAERLLEREQLSELDKEEFDKETVIIDRKLARNLETMQKNNAQDLSILNLDRAGQKELAALPAKARSEYLSNAKNLASIIDDLRTDASSNKQFNSTTALENGRKRVIDSFDATLDTNGNLIGKNGKPLSQNTRLAIDASYQTYLENYNSIYIPNPTAIGSALAAQYAGSQINSNSAAPANTTNLDQAVAAYNNDPSSISPENLEKLNAALISVGRPALGI
jgi:hypothetical protein